jgi:hypothetical protein
VRADDGRFCGRITLAEKLDLTVRPPGIRTREKKLIEEAKSQDVQKTKGTDALIFALHAPFHLVAVLLEDDDANQLREGSHPARQTIEIERGVVMADQEGPRRAGLG